MLSVSGALSVLFLKKFVFSSVEDKTPKFVLAVAAFVKSLKLSDACKKPAVLINEFALAGTKALPFHFKTLSVATPAVLTSDN